MLSFIRAVASAGRLITELCGKVVLRWHGVGYGNKLRLYGIPIVSVAPQSLIAIGNNVVLTSQSKYTALGVNHAVVLRTLRPGAELRIGNDVGMSGGSVCVGASVWIGDGSLLGANVCIADTDFHSLAAANRRYVSNPSQIAVAPVRIGNNVFLGTGSIVLKGVSIGDNSVIGAGSVVVSNVPANVIAAGNPCRVIRPLPPEASSEPEN